MQVYHGPGVLPVPGPSQVAAPPAERQPAPVSITSTPTSSTTTTSSGST